MPAGQSTDREPWEREPRETDKAWRAFCDYRDMDRSRSLAKVGQNRGESRAKNLATLEKWSSRYHWVKRCSAWDAHCDAKKREAMLHEAEEMAREHVRIANNIQSVVTDRLSKMSEAERSTIDHRTMILWLESAVKLKRQALGVDATKVELTGKGGNPIQADVSMGVPMDILEAMRRQIFGVREKA